MEEAVFKLFGELKISEHAKVILVDEATEATKGERRVDPQPDRVAAASKLRSLITELRREVL